MSDFFFQTDAHSPCSSLGGQFSLLLPSSRQKPPTPCSGSRNPRHAAVDIADRISAQPSFSTSLSPKTSQAALLDIAETNFPSEQDCQSRLQKFSEPPRNSKKEHRFNASSIDDPAYASTYNFNLLSISDDIAIRHEPLRNVNYLSHVWREDDIWSSWRYIVSNAGLHDGPSRSENALWRAWVKSKYKLKTVPPENISWLKDSDNNWLYGPLQSLSKSLLSEFMSEPATTVSKPTCFLSKRSILKKQSKLELMRQKLMSGLPVLKQADRVQIQHDNVSVDPTRDCPMFDGAVTDCVIYPIQWKTDSGEVMDRFSPRAPVLRSLDQGESKLLRFNEKVEQFRAVGLEDAEREWSAPSDDDSSDEGLLMKFPLKKRQFLQHNTGNNSSTDSKIIEKLPPTMINFCSSPPRKTLSRSYPSTNSLTDEEGDTEMFSVRLSKFSEAPDNFVAIHAGGAAEHGEKRLPEIVADISIPFEDDQDDAIAAFPVNELTNMLNKGKRIVYAIWDDGWLRLLERLLIQCQFFWFCLLHRIGAIRSL
ncbi:hypothetical protein GQ44DRAFT_778172 [Phaeosphaeriaceae sp. PMI808]|nr:hypothetical protein GQ44DRAFT_778172 [Phaeosphaeriaceae sp. PMI808]